MTTVQDFYLHDSSGKNLITVIQMKTASEPEVILWQGRTFIQMQFGDRSYREASVQKASEFPPGIVSRPPDQKINRD